VTSNATLTPPRPVPTNVAQLAGRAGLGTFQRVYLPHRRNWFVLVATFLFGLATMVIIAGFALLWMVARTPNLSRGQAARRLYLYERGFILADRPDAPEIFRFDEIDTVFQRIVSQRTYGIETARSYLYTVTRRDGRTVKLTAFWSGIAELGRVVNERVSAALLPGALAAIARGDAIQFGDIALGAGGVGGRRRSVSWHEVRLVGVAGGYVKVQLAGRFFPLSSTAAGNLPNLPLFLHLANRLQREAP